jgi:hypothetical protein
LIVSVEIKKEFSLIRRRGDPRALLVGILDRGGHVEIEMELVVGVVGVTRVPVVTLGVGARRFEKFAAK